MPKQAKTRQPKGKGAASRVSGPKRARWSESARDRNLRAMKVMAALAEAYPDARVALRFSDPLEMVVATVLSAQCTDDKVNEVTERLFKRYRTARDYAEAPQGELERDIHATGFFNHKANLLRGLGRALVERHGGEVPRTMAELVELPGVARKTANIVLGNAFGVVEGIAVDTHVRRLAQRLGFTEEEDPGRIEEDLMALLPRELWFIGTYRLIEHGRAICNAKRPVCSACPVAKACPRIGVEVSG